MSRKKNAPPMPPAPSALGAPPPLVTPPAPDADEPPPVDNDHVADGAEQFGDTADQPPAPDAADKAPDAPKVEQPVAPPAPPARKVDVPRTPAEPAPSADKLTLKNVTAFRYKMGEHEMKSGETKTFDLSLLDSKTRAKLEHGVKVGSFVKV